MSDPLYTSETLLGQLRQPGQPGAWIPFVRLYSPLIYSWVRGKGLQEADSSDLVQDVFRILIVKLPEFEYDPARRGFRLWLRTVTLNVWRNHCRQGSRREKPTDDLADIPDDGEDPFSEEKYRCELMGRAQELIRPEFRPDTWRAFVAHGIEGRPAVEVARELGTTCNAVYAARFRVVARLKGYLAGMLD